MTEKWEEWQKIRKKFRPPKASTCAYARTSLGLPNFLKLPKVELNPLLSMRLCLQAVVMDLCQVQQRNILLLYSSELADLLTLHQEDIGSLSDFVRSEIVTELRKKCTSDCHRFGTELWTTLLASQLNGALYGGVLNFVASRNPCLCSLQHNLRLMNSCWYSSGDAHLHACLSLNARDAGRSNFHQLLSVVHHLLPLMTDPTSVLEILSSIAQPYKDFADLHLKQIVTEGTFPSNCSSRASITLLTFVQAFDHSARYNVLEP